MGDSEEERDRGGGKGTGKEGRRELAHARQTPAIVLGKKLCRDTKG